RTLAERVIQELNLAAHPDLRPDGSGFSPVDFVRKLIPALDNSPPETVGGKEQRLQADVLRAFNERLSIAPLRNTNLVHVIFESTDPQLAANVANALANAYIESYLEQRLASTQQASSWMTERLSG